MPLPVPAPEPPPLTPPVVPPEPVVVPDPPHSVLHSLPHSAQMQLWRSLTSFCADTDAPLTQACTQAGLLQDAAQSMIEPHSASSWQLCHCAEQSLTDALVWQLLHEGLPPVVPPPPEVVLPDPVVPPVVPLVVPPVVPLVVPNVSRQLPSLWHLKFFGHSLSLPQPVPVMHEPLVHFWPMLQSLDELQPPDRQCPS